jgi:transposase
MPTERLSMRRMRQVLQLHFGARASARVIAKTVGVGRSTVQDYLARAAAAGRVCSGRRQGSRESRVSCALCSTASVDGLG